MQRNSAICRPSALRVTSASHTCVVLPMCTGRALATIVPSRAVREEVRLELDRREVLRALGQVRDASEAGRGVGQRDHRGRVQVAVGREQLRPDVELGVQQSFLQVDDAESDEPGQAAVAAVLELLERDVASQWHGVFVLGQV